MKLFPTIVFACGLALAQPVHAQQLDILVIGSTHSFSEGEIGQSGVVHEKPFNPTTIATRLQSILSQDALITGSVNVVFEDIYKTKSSVTVGAVTMNKDFRCYSLFQHMMWPDGKAARLSNLRGEAGTQWDYIIVCEDAYVMAHFPGMFAEGVKMLRNEVANSPNPAQIMLLAQWPESGSTFTADGFNEIVHRVGDSAGVPVVPAGKAWNSYGSKDTNTAHPTPKGQYLAAAAIHSKLFNRSASGSGYSYPSDGTNIANHAHSVVQANAGVAQYSGLYTTAHAFQMKYFRDRQVDWCENGTSTEEGFATGLIAAYADARINHIRRIPPTTGNPVDLHYSRGSDFYEPEKQYLVDAARFGRVHGFPMQHYADTGEVTMIYGIDKHYETNGAFENGSDLGVAYSMVREGQVPQDVRGIPVRLMWSKIDHFRPEIPAYSDSWHLNASINHAVGAYMYTLLSGRCPVDVEPANPASALWQLWFCRKVGYETAWQMAHLTTRAPGFRVTPSTTTRTSVTTTTPETMSVRFLNPPTSNVTVNVSISDPAVAMVSPSTLTFTPSNYNTPQTVTVTGKEITPTSAPFEVVYSTSSTDLSYHGLGDSWSYDALRDGSTVDLIAGFDGNNTSTISGSTKTLSNAHHGPDAVSAGVTATLWTTDTMNKEFQWTGANQTSLVTWGTLTLIPSPVSLNTNNVATIAAPTTLNFTINNTAGTKSIDLQNLHFSVIREAASATQLTIAYASGNLAGTNGVATLVNDTGVNRGYDFNLTTILTDRILAPGETATFTIAQTTSEIGRLKIDDIGISGEVLTSGPDTTAPNPDPMSWASEPTAENSSSITMTATTASDPSGVEYYFDETSGNAGGTDSGWQDNPAYTDSGLQADTQYTYTVTARDKAANPNATAASVAASVTTSPASSPVSAGSSTVAASPTTVPADGATTATITVTLKDFGGTPVSGKTVSLASNGSATIQTSNNTSNASGVVTFTVKSSTVGAQTFTATGDGVAITQTASVNFQALPVSAGTSTVIASPSTAPADGATTSTITVTLKNAGGGAISGKTVSLASNGSATIQTSNNVSNTSGVVTFTVKSSTVGTQIFTATGDGVSITQTASVDFQTVSTVSGLLGGFDGVQTQTAVGSTSLVLTSGVRQITGAKQDAGMAGAVSARIWTDQTTSKELQWGSTSQSTTTGNWGSTDFTTNASTATDPWVVSQQVASWINFEITNTGSVDVTLDKFHISANRTTTAAPTTLTVSLQENGSFANPVVLSGKHLDDAVGASQGITLNASTGWFHYEFSFPPMLTDRVLAAGQKATFRIANNAGTARLYLDNIAVSGTVGSGGGGGSDTTAPTPNPMTWASVPAAVNSTSITMTATTASDLSGVEYYFDETSGNPGGTDSGWQDGATYTDTGLNAATQYTYTVMARDKATTPNSTTASASASATTNAYVSPVSAGTSTVAASPSAIPADGTTTSTITVTLKDSGGAAVSGKTVSLVSNGSATIQTANSTSNASGVVAFTVKSGTVGTQTFTATGDGITITQTASVNFQTVSGPGPVNAGTSTVAASPTTVPADGTTISTITITLRDASGNPVPNEGVSLAKTSGPSSVTITPVDIQSTNGSGQATFTVRSGMAGTGVFTATSITHGIVITQTASVVFTQAGAVYLVALLPDPVSATSSSSTGTIANFYDGSETLANVGTIGNLGNMFAAVGTDSDGISGTYAHTVVYDMGQVISFDGFVHAQRKADGYDDVASIDFWVTNSDPGNASTSIPLAIFSTQPTPDASVNLTRNSAVLNEYLLPGGTLSGRYVVMRLNSARTSGANPGGYTLLLGQTASVSDFDTWASAYPGLGSSGNDDDGDGITNDAERIFGLNPQNPSSANAIAIPLDPNTGDFSYTRRRQSLTGLTYKTWYSTDLVDWYWESGAIETPRAPVGETETVDVTLDPELLNEPKLFIQISAENFGAAPAMNQIWGSGSSITMVFSEAMDPTSSTDPQNYTVGQSGGGTIAVSSAALSGDGKTVTLALAAPLGIDGDFTVTTNRIANGVGQPLGNGTSGQFQTWDDNPNGIKVFILAGQSNMVGYGMSETGNGGVAGAIGSLRYLAVNNGSYPDYDYASLLADPGQPATSAWKTRSDVKVWWRNGHSGNLGEPVSKGDLGPPFKGANAGWFGPEYAFGQLLGDYYTGENEPVLIIKAAWGGHTLVSNFRPPSAVAKRGGEIGASYHEIFNNAREVLSNLGTEFPEWAGRGYQIVGFGWHQGTSDRAPASAADEYKDNLPDLISDVRAEFGKPNLPFVIATTGMNNAGPAEASPYTGYHAVEKAQLWVAGVAKPTNVLSSDTRPFWRDSSISPSTTSFHWNHNAESYFLVGKALGEDMVTLLSE